MTPKQRAFQSLKRRLPSCTRRNGECLEWTGSRAGIGYGYISIRHDGTRTNFYVHRLICELKTGEIGIIAMHSCDNPACCNKDHIRWGTRSDNSKDMVSKGRHPEHMKVNRHRALTSTQVSEIRSSSETIRVFAGRFNVHHSCIWNVRVGNTYNDIAS